MALGLAPRGRHSFESPTYCITWAIGHLVALAEPHEMNPAWRKWRAEDLPLLPQNWPLVVSEGTAEQFAHIASLMQRPAIKSLIAATDAGREGELIFRYIYEKAGCTKPVERLWLSSMTDESIQRAMSQLRPLADFDRLADNARGRSRADWLVGFNLSRAYSLQFNDRWSVGRVQTPTLAMVVERSEAIAAFIPEAYAEFEVEFQGADSLSYRGLYGEPLSSDKRAEPKRFKPDDPALQEIAARAKQGKASVAARRDKEQSLPPPRLFDLTELQMEANRLYGYQAKQTLDYAQKLYESFKLITYPRSDSRYLSQDVAKGLPSIVATIRPPYERLGLHPHTGTQPLGKNFVDDSKVADHHAIIPVGRMAPDLPEGEGKIYDLIVRRLLMAWQENHIYSQSQLTSCIRSLDGQFSDFYYSNTSLVLQKGWKRLELRPAREKQGLPQIALGDALEVGETQILQKATRPPPAFTDASLLSGMASAGSRLDDKELTDILRERGLGTPATRAAIIEGLIKKGYIERRDKGLWATPLASRLIAHVHPSVRSAALTGSWEAKLHEIEKGSLSLDAFMQEIARYVQDMVAACAQQNPLSPAHAGALDAAGDRPAPENLQAKKPAKKASSTSRRQGAVRDQPHTPSLSSGVPMQMKETSRSLEYAENPARSLRETLAEVFGHPRFRPHQEEICRAISAGHDLLLVMPTGAGKSLCYQLPALMRKGCALVISPLIALMDDQVNKLLSLGIPAGALHSGLSREASRETFRRYLSGELKLLYLAPERLGLSGFLELLVQHPPSLIAVDEAHCISQWGHDFRPEYRMLAQRLPRLRPAPIVAMTATATPEVQKDILEQLALVEPHLHIHGFRRKNIAIEVTETPVNERAARVRELLKTPGITPSIIYAPTRRETESLSHELRSLVRIAPYHAGLSQERRQEVQADFLAGRLDAIVATIAFGMGIDKSDIRSVIHTSLPSSVESYYQEIGRAGRDGALSRAFLFYSYADHHTRLFFIKKNYPPASQLASILKKVPPEGILRTALSVHEDAALVDNALEKLWIHGAIEIDAHDFVRPQPREWRGPYLKQQAHKEYEVKLIADFAANQQTCRMLQFLEHFGDAGDRQTPCGLCDVCVPQHALTQNYQAPTAAEQQILRQLVGLLGQRPYSMKRLEEALDSTISCGTEVYQRCLEALLRAGHVWSRQESFEKDGKSIAYRMIGLKAGGPAPNYASLLLREASESKPTSRSRAGASRTRTASKEKKPRTSPSLAEHPLLQKLRGWRLRVARQQKIPAYRVFADRTLEAIVSARPRRTEDLRDIDGIGPVKLEKYGTELLALLNERSAGESPLSAPDAR